MIQFLKIIEANMQSPFFKHILWNHTENMLSYRIKFIFIMLKIFYYRGTRMEINEIFLGYFQLEHEKKYIYFQQCIVETVCGKNHFLLY